MAQGMALFSRAADRQTATDTIVAHLANKCLDSSGNHTAINLSIQISTIISIEPHIDARNLALDSLQVMLLTAYRSKPYTSRTAGT